MMLLDAFCSKKTARLVSTDATGLATTCVVLHRTCSRKNSDCLKPDAENFRLYRRKSPSVRRKATVWFNFSSSDLKGLAMRSFSVISSGHRPRPATVWSQAKHLVREACSKGGQGGNPLGTCRGCIKLCRRQWFLQTWLSCLCHCITSNPMISYA